MTDSEIDGLIKEMNRHDLLQVLLSEKGNAARVMMEELEVKEPPEYQHNHLTVKKLFENLKTDYYGRYDFREMQSVILEDRRIRLNAWVAKILDIPVEKMKLNKHVNPAATKKELNDPRSLNYTIPRIKPLPLIAKKPSNTATPLDFPVSIIDKKKYMPNEESMVINKLLHRNAYKFVAIENAASSRITSSTVFLMKNINEGRNGTWNNYATLPGNAVPSYIKYKSRFEQK